MGFGWLLFGYFVATFMSINAAGSFIRIIGYVIICFSAIRLRKYNRSFDLMLGGAILITLVSLLIAVGDGGEFLYNNMMLDAPVFSEKLRSALGYAESVCSFIFNGAMLWAISSIGKETGVFKVVSGALRNFAFIVIYYIMQVICIIPVEGVRNFAKEAGISLWALILYFVWVILNLVLIFNCYARICDENDTEMAQKPSRFAFVNKFRAELEEKQERARRSTEKYVKEKAEKKKNKQRRK